MRNAHVRQKLLTAAAIGILLIPTCSVQAEAAENSGKGRSLSPADRVESALAECFRAGVKEDFGFYMVATDEGEYLNMAFSDTEDYIRIRIAPDEESEWIGKLYKGSAAAVLDYEGEWTKIRSGSAEGYVPTDALITGNEARRRAREFEKVSLTISVDGLNVREEPRVDSGKVSRLNRGAKYTACGLPEQGWYPVRVGDKTGWIDGKYAQIDSYYIYGETKEEEELRVWRQKLFGNEVMDLTGISEEEARKAVTEYACHFIGNPYRWGGTSLTRGADCSGFVKSVFAHFGISLPRTSSSMRSSGYRISYSEAKPGDLILYSGHVGMYIGDGKIVNAISDSKGIGISSATYANIVGVRRVLPY